MIDAGIHNGLDLAQANTSWIRSEFSVVVERTVRELNGVACQEIEAVPPTKQQIVSSKSFGQPVLKLEDMLKAVSSYAVRASEKLRGEGQSAGQVTAFLSTSRYGADERYSNSLTAPLPHATQDTRIIVQSAIELIRKIWRPGFRYNKAGIMLGDFRTPGVEQADMFDAVSDSAKSEEVMGLLDRINASQGAGLMKFGRNAGSKVSWEMKRENLSPAFTTRWNDLPKAH